MSPRCSWQVQPMEYATIIKLCATFVQFHRMPKLSGVVSTFHCSPSCSCVACAQICVLVPDAVMQHTLARDACALSGPGLPAYVHAPSHPSRLPQPHPAQLMEWGEKEDDEFNRSTLYHIRWKTRLLRDIEQMNTLCGLKPQSDKAFPLVEQVTRTEYFDRTNIWW